MDLISVRAPDRYWITSKVTSATSSLKYGARTSAVIRSCTALAGFSLSIITKFKPNCLAIPSRMYRSVGKFAASVIIVFLPGRACIAAKQS